MLIWCVQIDLFYLRGNMPEIALRGVIAPVLTPFNDDLSIAGDLFLQHSKRLMADGCAGLAPFGTTGEALSVGIDERIVALDALIDGGIDPALLIPGTGLTALADTARLTRACLERGCAGVLLLPPFYYKGVSEAGLYDYFVRLIAAVRPKRPSIYLYHIPPVAVVGLPPTLVRRLFDDFPAAIAGIKDSSGDWANTATLLEIDNLIVYPGSELFLLDGLKAGSQGCITATANINAGPIAKVVERFDAGDLAGAEAQQEAISTFRKLIQGPGAIPGQKHLLAQKTGDSRWTNLRPPLLPFSAAEGRALVEKLGRAAPNMFRKTLILHIGWPKTGSTSIQMFLQTNRKHLRRNRIAALETFASKRMVGMNSSILSFLLLRPQDHDAKPLVTQERMDLLGIQSKEELIDLQKGMKDKLHQEVKALEGECSKFVISGENLSRLRVVDIKRLRKLCGDLFDEYKIVCYLRRQDLYLISRYSTELYLGSVINFDKYLNRYRDMEYSRYDEMLGGWSSVFGKEAMVPRIFEKDKLQDGDVVADFCKVCGIDDPHQYEIEPRHKQSLSALEQLILRQANEIVAQDEDREAQRAIRKLMSNVLVGIHSGRPLRPAPGLSQAIRDDYKDSNELLRKAWFPDLPSVFSEEVTASGCCSPDEPRLTAADVEPLLEKLRAYRGKHDRHVPKLAMAMERVRDSLGAGTGRRVRPVRPHPTSDERLRWSAPSLFGSLFKYLLQLVKR